MLHSFERLLEMGADELSSLSGEGFAKYLALGTLAKV